MALTVKKIEFKYSAPSCTVTFLDENEGVILYEMKDIQSELAYFIRQLYAHWTEVLTSDYPGGVIEILGQNGE